MYAHIVEPCILHQSSANHDTNHDTSISQAQPTICPRPKRFCLAGKTSAGGFHHKTPHPLPRGRGGVLLYAVRLYEQYVAQYFMRAKFVPRKLIGNLFQICAPLSHSGANRAITMIYPSYDVRPPLPLMRPFLTRL